MTTTDGSIAQRGDYRTQLPEWNYRWEGSLTEVIAEPQKLAATASERLFAGFQPERRERGATPYSRSASVGDSPRADVRIMPVFPSARPLRTSLPAPSLRHLADRCSGTVMLHVPLGADKL